eukprot:CAMPEP_0176034392 /NCGR_PEP_ID=MMETSP0120_2-20121206/16999_1 /TAXON_ID=160619 /ORGANISM="Kryptoperidinium foliaceum, Strain CCMP 1326" /LENGTH=87 /DNA_ID=CAMNT_0017367731 /DNA_START=67 /DNA_END=326 /DNA_ORIENTATION=-
MSEEELQRLHIGLQKLERIPDGLEATLRILLAAMVLPPVRVPAHRGPSVGPANLLRCGLHQPAEAQASQCLRSRQPRSYRAASSPHR